MKTLFPELSRQQRNIITVLSEECLSAKEISDKMCIAESTANNHIKDIKVRLGLSKNIELVREFFLRKIGSGVLLLILMLQAFSASEDEFVRRIRIRRNRKNKYEYILEN
jgi:DNA-binding CsgD family transcriptional regulator